MLEKTLESPLDCKIKPVNPKGKQPWIFIGQNYTKAEAPILWPHDAKSRLTGKDHASGKVWRQKKKKAAEDEMVGWHHWLNGQEFEQTLGDSKGQESLVCCNLYGHKDSDMTEQLNNNNVITVTSWFKDFCLQNLLYYILIQMKWAGGKGCNRFLINQVTGRLHTSFWCCFCCCSVTKPSPTLCNPIACSTLGLPAPHHLLVFPKVHVH